MDNGYWILETSVWNVLPRFGLRNVTYKWEFSWLYKFCNSQMPLFQEWTIDKGNQ